MRIQLDTTERTIKLEENVKISELLTILKKILPNGEWKEFILENEVIYDWVRPIIVERTREYPRYPWYCDNKVQPLVDNKTFCIDLKS